MSINDLAPVQDEVYFNPAFLKVVEDNLTYLRTSGRISSVTLTNTQCQKFQGDFFGLLIDLQVQLKHHHIVLRVNNLLHTGDFTGEVNVILMPDVTIIEQLKTVFETGPDM